VVNAKEIIVVGICDFKSESKGRIEFKNSN
jgi:hypothetical protein